MTDDASLVAAALQGGPEAYAPIVRRYQDTVFGVALGRLGQPHDAEDIAQSVFVEGWERLADLRDPARLGPWLRSIAVHRCIDLVRRNGRLAEQAASLSDHPDAPAAAGLGEPSDAGPEVALERAERRCRVLDAVARLSPTQRETVTLYYLNGYDVAEVARLLAVPAGTVKYRLHAAREKLSEELLPMVEDVLKDESPKDGFAERIFRLLNRYEGARGYAHLDEIVRIAADGVEGFQRALRLPHTPTRRWAFTMLGATLRLAQKGRVPATDEVVHLVKQGLTDPSKKVRRRAASVAMGLVSREELHDELAPLVTALLFDTSRTVRRYAATAPVRYPLEALVAARARETDEEIRQRLEQRAEELAEERLAETGGIPGAAEAS